MKRIKNVILVLFVLLSFGAFAFNYDEDRLKFYNDTREMSVDEIQSIYPDYQIILISMFNKDRKYYLKNSLFKTKKVLLLNDTKRTFHRFYIYPETSRGENKSLIKIYGKKNVRLKHFGGDEFEIVAF